MRRPTTRMTTQTRNIAAPMRATTGPSSAPARRPVKRKNTAPAEVAAQAGHPTCSTKRLEYTHAHSVDEGRVRMKPVNAGSPVASV